MNVYYVAGIPYSDELYHWGIKGQKWGIRRFQNSDGTYTEEGKRRYAQLNSKVNSSRSDMKSKEKDYKRSSALKSRYENSKASYNEAKKKARFTRDSKDYDSMIKNKEKLLDSKKAYKEGGGKRSYKEKKLKYEQSEWEYKRNVNKVNKFLGKEAKYKISSISPKAKNVGKKAAAAALLTVGSLAVLAALPNSPAIVTTYSGLTRYTPTAEILLK